LGKKKGLRGTAKKKKEQSTGGTETIAGDKNIPQKTCAVGRQTPEEAYR